jgi:predicted glycoside hydrolase/deacetylase ChbG (UPF0249 family)
MDRSAPADTVTMHSALPSTGAYRGSGATRTTHLIVNADDYGMTDGVNRAIEGAHLNGMVTSTTVLMAGQAVDAVASLRERCPEIGIGLHVNLTLGRPCADPARVRSLIDDEGLLLPQGRLFRRLRSGRIRLSEVRREVVAQAAALRRLGIEPTHWDPHETVAFWPLLRGAAAKGASDAGIQRVRSPRIWVSGHEMTPEEARRAWRRARLARLVTDANRLVARLRLNRRFASPSWRTGPNLVVGEMSYEQRWRTVLDSLPPAVCEVVSHPGHSDAALTALAPDMAESRETDLRILTDRILLDQMTAAGVHLIGFRDLPTA